MTDDPTSPRYPDCTVVLSGTSVHAVSIMMKVRRGLARYLRDTGMPVEKVEAVTQEFMDEAQSGDYDNVLITAMRWVTVD